MRKSGLYSSCLGDSSLSATTGSVFTSPQAEDALKSAGSDGGLPTGADIAALPGPYNTSACDADATLGIKPYVYNVFCNGDGTVPVRRLGNKHHAKCAAHVS